MSTNQETMRVSIAAALVKALADLQTAEHTRQVTIAAGGFNVGYRLGFPTGSSTYVAAVAASNAQLAADRFTAEVTKQGSVAAAKDLLRSQGEIPY